MPSVGTIARIVTRLGLNERPRRVPAARRRRGLVPAGRRGGLAELDAFDAIVDLPVFAHGDTDVLTGISLHGGDPDAWPGRSVTASGTCAALEERWRRIGRPGYAQFDNDTRFLGSHGYPDILGRVPLLVLRLGVTPVFAPIREMGFQADIEGFNGRWQRRVYGRAFGFLPDEIAAFSDRYLAAVRARRALVDRGRALARRLLARAFRAPARVGDGSPSCGGRRSG